MKAPWVVAAGKIGETAHCTRCGEGLTINMPQRLEVALAAMQAFGKIHAKCKPRDYQEPEITALNWPQSRDTGVSSATIWQAFTGEALYNSNDVPHDPSDFGRCYRLLKLRPEWEAELSEVSDLIPAWKPYVTKWPKLKELYEEALRTGDGNPMFEFMQKMRESHV
jgi:hypothetical protein